MSLEVESSSLIFAANSDFYVHSMVMHVRTHLLLHVTVPHPQLVSIMVMSITPATCLNPCFLREGEQERVLHPRVSVMAFSLTPHQLAGVERLEVHS